MAKKSSKQVPAWLMREPEQSEDRGQSAQRNGRALAEAIDGFRALYPQDWEQLRLYPLQHGIETIVEKLRVHPKARSPS